MNCETILAELDDYLDGELKSVKYEQMKAHLVTCDSCHRALQQERQFRQTLQEHPIPTPALGMEERAFSKLPQRTSKTNKHAFVAGFGGAMAAGIMVLIAATFFFNPVSQQQVPNIALTMHQSKKVKMVFNVPEMVAEATFSMKLPAHVEIAGNTGLHQIEWKTALKKGKNLLSLPIVATAAKSGELIAEIRYGDQIKTFRLKLDIQPIEQGQLNIMTIGVV